MLRQGDRRGEAGQSRGGRGESKRGEEGDEISGTMDVAFWDHFEVKVEVGVV